MSTKETILSKISAKKCDLGISSGPFDYKELSPPFIGK